MRKRLMMCTAVVLHALGCHSSSNALGAEAAVLDVLSASDAVTQGDSSSLDVTIARDTTKDDAHDAALLDRMGRDAVIADLAMATDAPLLDASLDEVRIDAGFADAGLPDSAVDATSHIDAFGESSDGEVLDAAVDVASLDRVPSDATRDAADVTPVWSPVEVPARRVFAGFGVTFMTAVDGSFWGWGWNADALLAPTEPTYAYEDTRVRPQRVSEHLDVRQMVLRNTGNPCALAGPVEGGTVWCWGLGPYRNYHLPDDTWAEWSVPHQLGTVSDVLGLATATNCIRSDHSYWAMRQRDSDWTLISSVPGFGSVAGVLYPAPRPAFRTADGVFMYGAPDYYDATFQRIAGIVDVVQGLDHLCLLRSDGHVMCWGKNGAGQTGNGFEGSDVCRYTESGVAQWTNCVPRPAEVPGLTDVVRVAAGTLRTCALRRDGTVWCWGQDEVLPDGTSLVGYGAATDEVCVPFESATVRHPEYAVPCRRRPTQIPGITDAVDLSVGTSHACVVRAGGQVLCWGANSGGQLGDGTTHYRTTPTPVRWY